MTENTTLKKDIHYVVVSIPSLNAACSTVPHGQIPYKFSVNGKTIDTAGRAFQISGKVVESTDQTYYILVKLEVHGSSFTVRIGKFKEHVQAATVGNTLICTGVSVFTFQETFFSVSYLLFHSLT